MGAEHQWAIDGAAAPTGRTEPTTIGRYRVLSHLGRGGMADVYKCVAPGRSPDDPVVVKRMLPQLVGDARLARMFLREADITLKLRHPNVVHIAGVERDGDAPIIVMEYVHGPTLTQLLTRSRERGEKRPLHAVHVLAVIARALAHLHEARGPDGTPRPIVHRDVTPPNIMVSSAGVPKLLDFGVAKSVGDSRELLGGILKGKTPYIAPEQLDGLEDDERTDIYAVGVCLYVATTGELPYRGDSEAEILRAIRTRSFARPSALDPSYPARLEEIVLAAMEPDRERRCSKAADLAAALESFLASVGYIGGSATLAAWVETLFPGGSFVALRARADTLPIFTTHPRLGPPPRRRRRARRRPWLLAGGLVTVGVVLTLLLLAFSGYRP